MKKLFSFVLVIMIMVSLTTNAFATDYPYTGDAYGADFENSDASSLKRGDVIALVGDSITHGATMAGFADTGWVLQLNYYLLTRFPELEIKTINLGIGGIKTQGAYDHQLENDYAKYDFNKAIFYLGTNDGTSNYDSLSEAGIKMAYGNLLDAFENLGAKTIALITPAGADESVITSNHKNFALKRLSDNVVKALGDERGIPVAYQFDEFQNTFPIALANKNIKMLQDGLHPSAAGSSVAFANLIETLNLPGEVATVVISGDAVEKQSNCTVSGFIAENGGYKYSYLAKALSLAQAGFVQEACEVMDYIGKFSREILQAKGLKAGTYQLKIDGEAIGEFTSAQLEAGINLANYDTPMVAQSLKVAQAASTMFAKMRQIRDMERTKYMLRLYGKADESNMLAQISELSTSDDEHAAICKGYLGLNAQMRLEKRVIELETLWTDAYEKAQPEAHTVEITPLSYDMPEENREETPKEPPIEPDIPTAPGTSEEPKNNTGLYIGIAAAAAVAAAAIVIVKKKRK